MVTNLPLLRTESNMKHFWHRVPGWCALAITVTLYWRKRQPDGGILSNTRNVLHFYTQSFDLYLKKGASSI